MATTKQSKFELVCVLPKGYDRATFIRNPENDRKKIFQMQKKDFIIGLPKKLIYQILE